MFNVQPANNTQDTSGGTGWASETVDEKEKENYLKNTYHNIIVIALYIYHITIGHLGKVEALIKAGSWTFGQKI